MKKSNLSVLVLLAAGMVLALLAAYRAYEEHYTFPRTPPLPPEPREHSIEAARLVSRAADLVDRDPSQSLDLLEQAIRKDPACHRAYADRGHLLLDLERYEEAEACFRSAVALKPRHSRYYVNHALCLARLGRKEEAHVRMLYALAALEEQLKPNRAKYHPARAVILFLLHKDVLARRELDAVKRANPDSRSGALASRLLTATARLKDGDRWTILRVQ